MFKVMCLGAVALSLVSCLTRTHNSDSELESKKQEVLSRPDLADVSYSPFTAHNVFSVFAASRNACAANCPVIIIVHGGGFVGGDKTDKEDMRVTPEEGGGAPYFVKGLASRLTERGYAVVNINYRLSSSVAVNGDREDARGSFPYPAAYEDAATVASYLRDAGLATSALPPLRYKGQEQTLKSLLSQAKVSLNPKRIGAIGFSAGGAIVGYLGLNRKVDAVVDSSGIADFYDEGQEALRQIDAKYGPQSSIDYFVLRYFTTDFYPSPEFSKTHEAPPTKVFAPPYKFHWLANWFRTENNVQNTPGLDPNWTPVGNKKGPKPPAIDRNELLQKYDEASLIRRTDLHKGAPFFMFVHGVNDGVVPVWHAKKFYSRLVEANAGLGSEVQNRYRLRLHNGKHDFGANGSEENSNYAAMFSFFAAALR